MMSVISGRRSIVAAESLDVAGVRRPELPLVPTDAAGDFGCGEGAVIDFRAIPVRLDDKFLAQVSMTPWIF